MDNELKMVISRGKVTFTRDTPTRCSSWRIVAGDDTDTILNVLEDILLELRPKDNAHPEQLYGSFRSYGLPESEDRSFDGVALQPPKVTVLGGNVDLSNVEPTDK